MQRRRFLQAAAAAGLALTIPASVRRAAADSAFSGPYWVLVHASGGWDPTLMFDPKLSEEHTRSYSEIGKIGNISFAPVGINLEEMGLSTDPGLNYASYLRSNEQFLQAHGRRMTVIHGVDTETNNHDTGTRSMWSGQTQEGYPAFGAMVAAAKAPTAPMAYLSSGGYDATNGLVGLTRISSISALQRIASPNMMDPSRDDSEYFHTAETWGRIRDAQRERIQALQAGENLPRPRSAMGALQLARAADGDLAKLTLPDELVSIPGGGMNDLQRMMQQAQIAIHAFKTGIGVSATLSIGGFDSHANNDRDQRRQQAKLLGGIDYILRYAEQQGLGQQIYVVVGSDFGRTPYNSQAGKDHHPVSSVFALGPGIPGDRVIGETTGDRLALPVDPSSLAVASSGGTIVTPAHIHRALRKLAGVDADQLAAEFPLAGQDLPLFS